MSSIVGVYVYPKCVVVIDVMIDICVIIITIIDYCVYMIEYTVCYFSDVNF